MFKLDSDVCAMVIFLFLMLIVLFIVSFWTQSSIEFWIEYFKGVHIHVPFWMAFLATIFLNAVILGFNICTEIFKLIN